MLSLADNFCAAEEKSLAFCPRGTKFVSRSPSWLTLLSDGRHSPVVECAQLGPDARRNLSQLVGGIGQALQDRCQLCDIGDRSLEPTSKGDVRGDPCLLFYGVPIENRVRKPDQWFSRCPQYTLSAQHLEAGKRRQHDDGMPANEPVHILERFADRVLRNENLGREAGQRSIDDEAQSRL